MHFFRMMPPAAAEFGPDTICDDSYSNFQFVHFLIDHYPDDVIARFPIVLVSETFRAALLESGCTGYAIKQCKISKSEQYDEIFNKHIANPVLPEFYQLEAEGIPFDDDFGIHDFELIVSARIKKIVEKCHCPTTRFE